MKLQFLLATLIAFMITSVTAFADEYVNGYSRSDGTYVPGYYRSSPNSTVQDNFTYKGNTNPYTGTTGTNKYYSSPSSEYYNGTSKPSSSYGSTYSTPQQAGIPLRLSIRTAAIICAASISRFRSGFLRLRPNTPKMSYSASRYLTIRCSAAGSVRSERGEAPK